MPTYEYACRTCDEQLEVVQSFRDDPLTDCPSCGGELRKVFSPVGISFKGSGFYKNDSRSAKRGSKATSSAKESSDSGSVDSKDKPKSEASSNTPPSGSSSSSESSSSSGSAAPTTSAANT